MRRRAFLGVLAILALLFATTGTALALLIRHVPAFYERVAQPDRECRETHCRDFFIRSSEFYNMIEGDQPWEQQFTQEHFNGYFQSQDDEHDFSARIVELPEEIRDIRIAFEDDRVRLGFRYGGGHWTSVISVEFRVWLVANKANVIALELCDFRAGALPLGTRSLIDFITEGARRQNIDVTWFRHAGHPIALLQLQGNRPRPTFQLRKLVVQQGKLIVASSPIREPSPQPPVPTTPATPDAAKGTED